MAKQEMLLDTATIKAAVAGEKWAKDKVIEHYTPMIDELAVDEDMKQHLILKLLEELPHFPMGQAYYLKTKISSIGVFTALEISIANFSDGLYCAFSRRMIVSRRTPTISANCSCVNPFICLYCFNLHSKSGIVSPHLHQSDRRGHSDKARIR